MDALLESYRASEVNQDVVWEIAALLDKVTYIANPRFAHKALKARHTVGVVEGSMIDKGDLEEDTRRGDKAIERLPAQLSLNCGYCLSGQLRDLLVL